MNDKKQVAVIFCIEIEEGEIKVTRNGPSDEVFEMLLTAVMVDWPLRNLLGRVMASSAFLKDGSLVKRLHLEPLPKHRHPKN